MFKFNGFIVGIVCGAVMLGGAGASAGDKPVAGPALFDPQRSYDLPDLAELHQIRFLTENDYPPLQFTRSDGELAGFNVELARLICEELKITCTVQPWRWDKLNEALANGAGDAIIASQKPTRDTATTQTFSEPYYLTPARFVAARDLPAGEINADTIKGKTVGVVSGSAHEAYLKAAFPGALAKIYPSQAEAETALQAHQVELLFGDGLSLSIWLAQNDGACCGFRGGPYFSSYFFGEGARIAMRRDDNILRAALNATLFRLDKDGRLAELYWKYFPVGFY